MKIVDFRLGIIKNRLKKPFVTNIRTVEAIEDVCLQLICDDGGVGFGEAPPTVAITGEDLSTINETIKTKIFPAIKGIELVGGDDVFVALNESVAKNSSAKACVDMAIYDILSKSAKLPLYEYLGGKPKKLKTNLTISLNTPSVMLQDAISAYTDGFEILKIKVGKEIGSTITAIKEIRSALPNAVLRVDANQAWSAKTALKIIDSIEACDIELIEQPAAAADLAGLKEITARSSIPILADESVFGYDDAVKILQERMADYINIKLMKTGGIYNAAKIVALAKEHGAKIMMGSMLESVVSVSAAAHFAMSDDSISFYDLDGPLLAESSDVKNALILDKDEISFAPSIGLGVQMQP